MCQRIVEPVTLSGLQSDNSIFLPNHFNSSFNISQLIIFFSYIAAPPGTALRSTTRLHACRLESQFGAS